MIERIEEIDQNKELYLQMQKEPIIKDGLLSQKLLEEHYYRDWIYGIIDQGCENAIKRSCSYLLSILRG